MLQSSELTAALLEQGDYAAAHARRSNMRAQLVITLSMLTIVATVVTLASFIAPSPSIELASKPAPVSKSNDEMKEDTMLFIIDFLAGGFAGAVSKTVAAPIERVKLLIQTQDANPLIYSGKEPRYTSMADCFARVYKEQGLLAFWRGNLPNVLRYFPIAAFNFAFKDSIEGLFPKYDPATELIPFALVNLFAGGMAGAMSLTLVFPLDYARTRLASDVGAEQRQFTSMTDCLVKTMRSNGIFALYKGYAISVVGIFFYRAPYFGLFDTLEGINPFRYKEGDPWNAYVVSVFSAFVLAQVVAVVAASVSYPFDTIRRRLQMESEVPPEDRIYKGAFHCTWHIVTHEGVGGLFKGFIANLWRGAATAAILVIYQELTRHVLPHRISE